MIRPRTSALIPRRDDNVDFEFGSMVRGFDFRTSASFLAVVVPGRCIGKTRTNRYFGNPESPDKWVQTAVERRKQGRS